MTKFFFKLKKPYFWPISPIFGAKKGFLQKLWLSHPQLPNFIIFLNLLDPSQTVFLTAAILGRLDWSHDSD